MRIILPLAIAASLMAGAEAHGRAAKQLRVRGDLGVHLQAKDDFPGAGAALDKLGCGVGHDPVLYRS